jgi:hypothetical protein
MTSARPLVVPAACCGTKGLEFDLNFADISNGRISAIERSIGGSWQCPSSGANSADKTHRDPSAQVFPKPKL